MLMSTLPKEHNTLVQRLPKRHGRCLGALSTLSERRRRCGSVETCISETIYIYKSSVTLFYKHLRLSCSDNNGTLLKKLL